MKMTRERKIIVTVLGVAALALVVDRATSSPASAEAGESADSLLIAPEPRQAALAKGSLAGAPTSDVGVAGAGAVARRLSTVAKDRGVSATQIVDLFEPSPRWQLNPTIAATTDNSSLDAAQRVFEKHKLTSLIGGGRGGAAVMIDGKYVRLGQSLDGFILVAVDKQSVVFEREGVQVKLGPGSQMHVARTSDASRIAGAPLSAP